MYRSRSVCHGLTSQDTVTAGFIGTVRCKHSLSGLPCYIIMYLKLGELEGGGGARLLNEHLGHSMPNHPKSEKFPG